MINTAHRTLNVQLPGDGQSEPEKIARRLCASFAATQEGGCDHCRFGECTLWEEYLSDVATCFYGLEKELPIGMIDAARKELVNISFMLPKMKTRDLDMIVRRVLEAAFRQFMEERDTLAHTYIDRLNREQGSGEE